MQGCSRPTLVAGALLAGLCVDVSLLGGCDVGHRVAKPPAPTPSIPLVPLTAPPLILAQPIAGLEGFAPEYWMTPGPTPTPNPKWTTGSPLPEPVVYSTATIDPRSFPVRPAAARLYHVTGIFLGYGFGMHSGGIAIKTPSNNDRFFFANGEKLLMNGAPIPCGNSPWRIQHRHIDAYYCSRPWPKDLVPGKTFVKLTYWKIPDADTPPNSAPDEASDRIWYDAR